MEKKLKKKICHYKKASHQLAITGIQGWNRGHNVEKKYYTSTKCYGNGKNVQKSQKCWKVRKKLEFI
jgi:hypothetical protein